MSSEGSCMASPSVSRGILPLQRQICEVCNVPLVGQQEKYCSDHCRWVAWDRANPRQRALPLDPAPAPFPATRDQRVPKSRRRHFSEQAQTILSRIEEGPVSNWELARMFPPATAWRSRLSDARWELRRRYGLRDEEQPIGCHDCGHGLVWHWIEANP
jgi:predicted nucleic acid-binding Zn ribbon protein